jgi:AmiR/NasT family two-component response regulator
MNDRAIKTTFTIDLLKGQGLPLRSSPGGIAITIISAAIPIVIAIVIAGLYTRNKIDMSMKRKQITQLAKKVEKLSDTVETQKALEQ